MRTYYKITMQDGSTWYASSMQIKDNDDKTIAYAQKQADRRGIGAKYEKATREEYLAYFNRK